MRLDLHLLLGKAKVLLGGDNTNSVGVSHTTAPALDTDDGVALVDNTELETVVDRPLKATVDILLPDLDVEVGLLLGEEEGPHTTVQVGVLKIFSLVWFWIRGSELVPTYARGGVVTSDHQNGAHGAVLGEQTSSAAAEKEKKSVRGNRLKW